MKIKDVLTKIAVKKAETTIDPRTFPFWGYQPKLPAKIQEKIDKAK